MTEIVYNMKLRISIINQYVSTILLLVPRTVVSLPKECYFSIGETVFGFALKMIQGKQIGMYPSKRGLQQRGIYLQGPTMGNRSSADPFMKFGQSICMYYWNESDFTLINFQLPISQCRSCWDIIR